MVCPLRVFLVVFSTVIAGYFAWRTWGSHSSGLSHDKEHERLEPVTGHDTHSRPTFRQVILKVSIVLSVLFEHTRLVYQYGFENLPWWVMYLVKCCATTLCFAMLCCAHSGKCEGRFRSPMINLLIDDFCCLSADIQVAAECNVCSRRYGLWPISIYQMV